MDNKKNLSNAEKLARILDEKLEREYTKFCNTLKTKSPEEIIDKAYELTVKRELKDEIKALSWHDKEMAIMIDQVDLLDEFYHDWLNTDIALGDVLIDSLEDSVSMLTRYYGKQNLFKVVSKSKDKGYDR